MNFIPKRIDDQCFEQNATDDFIGIFNHSGAMTHRYHKKWSDTTYIIRMMCDVSGDSQTLRYSNLIGRPIEEFQELEDKTEPFSIIPRYSEWKMIYDPYKENDFEFKKISVVDDFNDLPIVYHVFGKGSAIYVRKSDYCEILNLKKLSKV